MRYINLLLTLTLKLTYSALYTAIGLTTYEYSGFVFVVCSLTVAVRASKPHRLRCDRDLQLLAICNVENYIEYQKYVRQALSQYLIPTCFRSIHVFSVSFEEIKDNGGMLRALVDQLL